ncbi:MAG: type IX secretion system sortase PorU [Bacteroidales bacterium]
MKNLILICSLFIPALLPGQSENVVIEWDTNHDQLIFPHALYADGDNTLPYLTRKIEWNAPGTVPVVTLKVEKTSETHPGMLRSVPLEKVNQEPLLEYALVRESGRPFVVVKILPFIKKGSGAIEKVDRFTLQLEAKTALAPLRSESTGNWAGQSVLSSGNWFKIAVEESGMHRLTYEQLKEIGIQNPASVRVYGTGARQLPEKFSKGSVDDLRPVPVYMDKGSDGMFSPGDQILFYAEGPVAWEYNQQEDLFISQLHHYSWQGFYFLTDSQGPAIAPGDATPGSGDPSGEVDRYDFRIHFEEEKYNLISSGKEWYGDNYKVILEYNYPFSLPKMPTGEPVRIRASVAARSGVTSDFRAKANGTYLGNIPVQSTDLGHYTSTFAFEGNRTFPFTPQGENLTVSLQYVQPDSDSEGWLNQLVLNGRGILTLEGVDELSFRDKLSSGSGKVARFHLGKGSGSVIWEITDPSSPLNVPYTLSGEDAVFTMDAGQTREYIAFKPGGTFPTPQYTGTGLGAVVNQNLHALGHPDMIIIAPVQFLEEAERLSQHRRANDDLDVIVVLQEQVFNEFSSGTPDVSAIRNFMKMFYDRSEGQGEYCRYLLLFGDGSFDNRTHPDKKDNPNLILTYQSDNSLSPTQSFVSDDFFGLLDTDESMYDGLLDIGIGRLTVSTLQEAKDVVDKIISYSDLATQGSWRNQLCFIGDDEDSNIHMRQAEALAAYVSGNYPSYNINKIYLDAYPQVKGATGFRYPDVQRGINDQVNRGALIVNYTGHGGPAGLAHEQVVTTNDILSWSNDGMLPLFMTATCEFSRYDEYDRGLDLEITSAGEEVLLNNNGGGIGLFTTTRLVYSGPNHALNERFYEVVFEKDANNRNYRLGDIIVYSKNNTGAGVNKRNFTLLGDPSLRLAYPEHRVVTDSINGICLLESADTLSAFDWVRVTGHVETRDGALMEGFRGEVFPMVFDKEKKIETLSNDGTPPWDFMARNSILYSGTTTVTNGRFSFGFYVPKDISYAFGRGKISYYSNDSALDAHGSCEGFIVGGIGTENVLDKNPPEIGLFMNDTFFRDGGITDPHPTLLVIARDNYGINTTGNGIGHDITAVLDNNRGNALILNEFFTAGIDSYNTGMIRYPYSNLETGPHEITVKVWDIHNNSAEESLEFLVIDSEEMLIEELFNYPNPFSDHTLFNIEHNRPDRAMRLVITIHNLSGEMVRIIDRQVYSPGYRLEPVEWAGDSSGGARLGGGVYIYRATLTTEDGQTATASGKLVLLN